MTILTVINKRPVLRSLALTACAFAALFLVQCGGGGDSAIFVKEPLPYSQDALAPTISADNHGVSLRQALRRICQKGQCADPGKGVCRQDGRRRDPHDGG